MIHRSLSCRQLALALTIWGMLPCGVLTRARGGEEKGVDVEPRRAWTTSRVIGSPDPPLPFTVEPVYRGVAWRAPIYVVQEPGAEFLLVVEQGGEKERPSRVLRLRDDPAASATETFLELAGRLIYSVAFHPEYRENGLVFVFSNGPTGERRRSNRISRFQVARRSSRADLASELTLLEWRSEGHDGGDLAFGRDRMLYISSGDGTTDSDTGFTGQDLGDLLGGVLRIDVDHRGPEDRPYSIPSDNPFVHLAGARGELWAYGLRNPWRLSIDPVTDDLWVGNNGQDLWETVHLVRRGENYGWSVYEGNHPFSLNRPRGPTPFVPPTIEHHHREARSLTGGVVYRGGRLAGLDGVYIYGDYSTGKIWGARADAGPPLWPRELADTTLQIACFAGTRRGDLVIADHGGDLYRLVPAPQRARDDAFPQRLSDTGLFASVARHEVQPGVIPYSVSAAAWVDGLEAERFLALPAGARLDYTASRGWTFPDGAVLVQTLSFPRGEISPSETSPDDDHPRGAARRLETRLLTRQGGEWAGYSYRWNDEQTDAILVPRDGLDVELSVPAAPDASAAHAAAVRLDRWRFPSRAECMSCHSRAANFVLGLTALQMNRASGHRGAPENQLRVLERLGVFANRLPGSLDAMPRLVDPYDDSLDLEARARSYLEANCAHCHVEAGGGNSRMELGFSTARERMNLISARPQHDTFGIEDAMLVAPGEPLRSILHRRVTRRGSGQMPPLGTRLADQRAARLLRDWIGAMQPAPLPVRDWKLDELLPRLGEVGRDRSFEAGRAAFARLGCRECHRFQGEGGGAGPDLTGVGSRLGPREILEALVEPSKTVAPEYATTVVITRAGRVVSGRLERETDAALVLRTPEFLDEPLSVPRTDIAERSLSSTSPMPRGMLKSLEGDEILDLVAYLIAGGERGHAAFR